MDTFLLEGWMPIILAGLIPAIVIIVLAKLINKIIFYNISLFLCLVCVAIFLYSIFGVGGWAGMGLGFFTIAVFLGIIVGSLISIFVKRTSL